MTSREQHWDRGGRVGWALDLRSSVQKPLEKIETTKQTSKGSKSKKVEIHRKKVTHAFKAPESLRVEPC